MALHDGQVAEMATGEGKTLVATLPAYLNALTGQTVHIVTVNDYLAVRDADWMGKVFTCMGMTCAAVTSDMTTSQYKHAFSRDITYVTGQELGFAYLRDNTAPSAYDLVLPERLHFAIVDEADSILIDESRNPMIISLPLAVNTDNVVLIDKIVRSMWEEVDDLSKRESEKIKVHWDSMLGGFLTDAQLQKRDMEVKRVVDAIKSKYYKVDQQTKTLTPSTTAIAVVLDSLVECGVTFKEAVEQNRPPQMSDVFEDPARWGQLATTAFKAYELQQAGKQYIVKDDKIVLVDENTGRLKAITRYQDGMHQALEAKEGVPIKKETIPTANITFQVFFRFYSKLAGMTGTATPAAAEFYELYRLKVVQVPTNKPLIRVDLSPRLYFDPKARVKALCSLVEDCWDKFRPVLIGTSSVQESEVVLHTILSYTSDKYHVHKNFIQVLNAKPDKVRLEAQIVAQAGLPGSVTIATNMAGRGTDIILGGSAEGLTKMLLLKLVYKRLMQDEEASSLPLLPLLLSSGPLSVFDTSAFEEAQAGGVMGAVNQRMQRFEEVGAEMLPDELHRELMAPVLLAALEGDKLRKQATKAAGAPQSLGAQTPQLGLMSYQEASDLATWVMEIAYLIRRSVYERIRLKSGGQPPSTLQYSIWFATHIRDVLAEQENLYVSAPQGQQFAVKAAVYLWMWLDNTCYSWSDYVRAQGGLLVVGTSLQESPRVEFQLRGRAGRQGDPGASVFLYDVTDPLLSMYNQAGMYDAMRELDRQHGVSTVLDGTIVKGLTRYAQRFVENFYSNSRLEMLRYDEILEDYRRSVYSLRRLLLLGTQQQRTQVLYMFVQFWVDQLVAKYMGSGSSADWMRDTVPLAEVPSEVRAATAGAADRAAATVASSVPGCLQGFRDSQQPQWAQKYELPPLCNVASRLQDASKNSATRNVLEFMGVLQPAGGPQGQQQQQPASAPSTPSIPPPRSINLLSMLLSFDYLEILTLEERMELGVFMAQSGGYQGPLDWMQPLTRALGLSPEPPTLSWPTYRGKLTARQQLGIATHARLYGFYSPPSAGGSAAGGKRSGASSSDSQKGRDGKQDGQATEEPESSSSTGVDGGGSQSSSMQGEGSGWAAAGQLPDDLLGFGRSRGVPAAVLQRPELRGPHAHTVGAVRDYLGVVAIHALELRRQEAVALLMGAGMALVDVDAQEQINQYQCSTMLNLLDAVWSVFLEEVESLKKAVNVKTYGVGAPLDEFRLDANRAFLATLATYRELVVEKVMLPDIMLSAPLDDTSEDAVPSSFDGSGSLVVDSSNSQPREGTEGDSRPSNA
ncbi:SecA DEAD-like domain-containing protein [Dunaliella salina]|uniref:chloroplast protein-transporting ATPase n=1 Tax=Dunaliella salina TaxID=3046 RepID=A0ABQ7H6E4_DUNSA|nr:SecA DEAD-like domain-containing protein [Dunaliella salina]|eukprot:KAF5842425.1 SecA DEAD-like domain-containing protein [Dunaliella salina]